MVFLLGQAENEEQLLNTLAHCREPKAAARQKERLKNRLDEALGGVRVETPDRGLDLLMNRWLLYQTLVSRLWNKSGYYQCGGAFGYRDQLQDTGAFLWTRPEFTRQQIIRAACHQFEEGDVQHWWHPIREPGNQAHRGIRTRHSDSHLWLCELTLDFLEVTGDEGLLDFKAPYLTGEPLLEQEAERYFVPGWTEARYPIYDHCLRAIRFTAAYLGPHGLCLIRRGDWNDGMNLVGKEDRGESVWLSMFFAGILNRFAPLCEKRGDVENAGFCRELERKLRAAIEQHGWDGNWYLRGYWDDGEKLGSAGAQELQIDSLPQSFAVLSLGLFGEREQRALTEAFSRLYDKESGVCRLFTPPFEHIPKNPGYIKGYPPGVRENGGQYTHAAVWLAAGLIQAGRADEGYEILRGINPVYHTDTREKQDRYRIEGYVLPGDVYSTGELTGMGGWSFYTGSAGWYYRVVLRDLLGVKREGDSLVLNPRLPKEWESAKVTLRRGGAVYELLLRNDPKEILLDGVSLQDNRTPFFDDGKTHKIELK